MQKIQSVSQELLLLAPATLWTFFTVAMHASPSCSSSSGNAQHVGDVTVSELLFYCGDVCVGEVCLLALLSSVRVEAVDYSGCHCQGAATV
jgi:hypothetical protein